MKKINFMEKIRDAKKKKSVIVHRWTNMMCEHAENRTVFARSISSHLKGSGNNENNSRTKNKSYNSCATQLSSSKKNTGNLVAHPAQVLQTTSHRVRPNQT